jgi:hypothetical protein
VLLRIISNPQWEKEHIQEILEKSDILPNERIHMFSINNGQRIETFAIKGGTGSKEFGSWSNNYRRLLLSC